jgi:hypothetical protein
VLFITSNLLTATCKHSKTLCQRRVSEAFRTSHQAKLNLPPWMLFVPFPITANTAWVKFFARTPQGNREQISKEVVESHLLVRILEDSEKSWRLTQLSSIERETVNPLFTLSLRNSAEHIWLWGFTHVHSDRNETKVLSSGSLYVVIVLVDTQ